MGDLPTVNNYDSAESLRKVVQEIGCCGTTFCIDQNIDEELSYSTNIEDEVKRLQTLQSYRMLDADKEESFERITGLAARLFDVPICLVSLVDLGRQWFMSNRGLGDVRETPRNVAFCAHAIRSKLDIFIINDATADPRFKNNSLVTGDPNIRFYAGAPLRTPEGFKIGTLCIIDTKPRLNGLSLTEKQNLMDLAGMVIDTIVVRKEKFLQLSKDCCDTVACTAHDLLTPLTCIQLNLNLLAEDESLQANKEQRDLLSSASDCADMVGKLCHRSMKDFQNSLNIAIEHKSTSPRLETEGLVNIDHLVSGLRNVMKSYPKKVPLSINKGDDVPKKIVSHDLSLFRSSLNILTNACKLTESGFVNFNIYVREAEENKSEKESQSPDMLVFECEDTGPGVDPELGSELFKPFGGKMKVQKGSLGLGLYSVAKHIGSLQGSFGHKARNNENEDDSMRPQDSSSGSIFWFEVPIIVPNAFVRNEDASTISMNLMQTVEEDFTRANITGNDLVQPDDGETKMINDSGSGLKLQYKNSVGIEKEQLSSKREREGGCSHAQRPVKQKLFSSARKRNALIIDDSITIRKSVNRALTKLGFAVDQAENGLHGLIAMKLKVYDIVFCDFLMPVMDGLDCTKQYREWERAHRPWIRQFIVGISAHAHALDASRGLKMGMDKFLSKPVPLKTLKEVTSCDEIKDVSKEIDLKLEAEQTQQGNALADGMILEVSEHSQDLFCLIALESISNAESLGKYIELHGWRTCIVNSGDDVLSQLKSRNWDAVFVDNKLHLASGIKCVEEFRLWELENRIARQNNIFLANAMCSEGTIPPKEFDGVVGLPLNRNKVVTLLDSVQKKLVIA